MKKTLLFAGNNRAYRVRTETESNRRIRIMDTVLQLSFFRIPGNRLYPHGLPPFMS